MRFACCILALSYHKFVLIWILPYVDVCADRTLIEVVGITVVTVLLLTIAVGRTKLDGLVSEYS